MATLEQVDATLVTMLVAWRDDVDSEPFPEIVAPASAVRKDYGPAGACAPKAALLLVRLVWKLVRR